ncbi:alpha/beta hydrolase family protein [Fervidobacterium thailandense]|uniref:Peptidase S9 n=1 Tax=Fervidobacterium thailandense TaxID=1008305 RepID=A0A1E3G1Y4_9BACT|nr:alpha/beta hydrolase [Fervidobacterium thailandense]ODN30267.1 peptidase S9 [Fervidobacterium thailandense]
MRFSRNATKKFALKILLLIAAVVLGFWNAVLTLLVIFIFNIPLIRKAVFGKLPTDPGRKGYARSETHEYITGRFIDIYYPDCYSHAKGVVMFAHGGGWISGYKRQPNNMSWYRFLLSQGFIVASIEYSRGYKAGIELLISELESAIKFLNGKFQTKISLMGLSAGGHLALLTASRNYQLVKNVISYYAPSDLLDIWESPSIFARIAALATLKRLPSKDKNIYAKYSPVNNVHGSFPPTLLVHGLKDDVVPYISSVKMFKKLKEQRVHVKLLLHPSGGHGFEFVQRDGRTVEILQKTIAFLEEKLW